MPLLVNGVVDRVNERPVTFPDGTSFVEKTIVVKDWGATLFVTVGRNFPENDVPSEGDNVALAVVQRSYVRKNSNPPEAGVALTAVSRDRDVETKLFAGSRVKAV